MSGWIEHNGTGAPDLPLDTRVEVRIDGWPKGAFSTEAISYWHGDGTAEDSNWIWPSGCVEPMASITHYRVVPE